MVKPEISDSGVMNIKECDTDISEYTVSFYKGDVDRTKIDQELEDQGFEIVNKETKEGGHFVTLFVNSVA